MDFLEKLKNILLPTQIETKRSIGDKNKSSLLIDEIVYEFEDSILQRSTPRHLIFNTAYVAYVPKPYYRDLFLIYGIITKEIVEIFNEKINERLRKDKTLQYTPVCESWSFDLIALDEKGCDIPDEENPESKVTYEDLEERFVAVRSSLISNDLYDFSNLKDEDELRTNKSQTNSKIAQMQRLSIGVIRGLTGHGYSYPIVLNGSEVSSEDSPTPSKVLAVLKSPSGVSFMDLQGNKSNVIDIRLQRFFIGGKSAGAMYQGAPIIRLDSEEILNPHLEIKQESDKAFYVRPLGQTELSLISLEKNKWYRLPDKNASLMLNENIEVTFNKK